MSQTTGTGAKKIEGSDNWRDIFDIHNDTVDAYDGKIGTVSMPTTAQTLTGAVAELDGAVDKVADGLAIIANGNTHAAITAGWFVYIRKHDSLADGLYKATANVAANGTLSSSNVTADPSGGLNALNEQIGNKLVYKKVHVSPYDTTNSIYDSGVSTSSYYCIGGMLPNDDDIEVRVCAKNGTWQYTLWSISSGGKIGNNYNYWVHLSFLSRTNLTEIT